MSRQILVTIALLHKEDTGWNKSMNGLKDYNNCNKILLVCGTAETTELALAIAEAGFSVLISTATDAYINGLESESEKGKIARRCGRLNEEGFVKLIQEESIFAVVNACHPYASDLRKTAINASDLSGIPCISYVRPEDEYTVIDNCICAVSHEEAAQIAFSYRKPVFLTTGSKNLIPYVKTAREKEIKIIARVLPRIESLSACLNAGMMDHEIIAARGPFTTEENIATIRRFNAGVIVTKSSGKKGGFIEKIEAARICNCITVIINRPEVTSTELTFTDIFSLSNFLCTYKSKHIVKEITHSYSNCHGGNLREIAEQSGLETDKIIDFSANINPIGPVPDLNEILTKTSKEIINYPDPDYNELKKAICKFGGWNPDMIIPANGASELLYATTAIATGNRALIPIPSYSDYTESAKRAGLEVKHILTLEENNFRLDINTFSEQIRSSDIVFIGRPNNPTGQCVDIVSLTDFIRTNHNSTFVIDESFLEFSPDAISIATDLPKNAIMIRSMTKFYAIPGLRLGYAIAHPDVAKRISKQLTPWGINCFAQAAGIASLENKNYQLKTSAFVSSARAEFVKRLSAETYLRVFPSDTNFLLIKLDDGLRGAELYREFIKQGIAIRRCSNFPGLNDQFIRVAIRTVKENNLFIQVLNKIRSDKRS
jgi:threonine-phosphate decarboxylase